MKRGKNDSWRIAKLSVDFWLSMQRMAPIQLHRNVPVFRWSGGAAHFAFWLSTAQLIAAIGRLLCDPIADVRDSELEWPFWVDSSP
jgi:hypothetical protein